MLTYIAGDIFVSLAAEGMARMLSEAGETVKVFFAGATNTEISEASERHTQIIVCWPQSIIPDFAFVPDCFIKTLHPVEIVEIPASIAKKLGSVHIGTPAEKTAKEAA